mgnify:CR=1 FL=1
MIANAKNTYQLIARAAAEAPDAPALKYLDNADLEHQPLCLTRKQLIDEITRCANMLRCLGVQQDDAVSILLPNLPQAQIAFWGAQAAGIVNPINFLLSADHIADIMNAACSRVVIALGPSPALDIWQKTSEAAKKVPSLEHIVWVGGQNCETGFDFDALVAQQSSEPLPDVGNASHEDIAAYFHTGGTTGAPKLVCHTHRNEVHAAEATARACNYRAEDVVMLGMPMFHVAGPILLSLAAFGAGAELVVATAAGNRNPGVLQSYWRLIERHRVTVFGGVPTSLIDILDLAVPPLPDRRDGLLALSGGAALSPGVQQRFTAGTGFPVHQIYGMTETAGAIAITPRNDQPRPGSVGKAIEGMAVRIVDPISHQPLGPGQTGKIEVKGPCLSPGYKRTGQLPLCLCDEQGWFDTGDLGSIDGEGWLFVTGRTKDVIIRGGHNIDPAMIEEIADRHPDVVQAAAVGRPDVRAGEVPVLFVTLRDGTEASCDEVLQFVHRNISEAPAKPVAIYGIPEMPKTAIGKLYRPALRQRALRDHFVASIETVCGAAASGLIVAFHDGDGPVVRYSFDSDTSRAALLPTVLEWLNENGLGQTIVSAEAQPA